MVVAVTRGVDIGTIVVDSWINIQVCLATIRCVANDRLGFVLDACRLPFLAWCHTCNSLVVRCDQCVVVPSSV